LSDFTAIHAITATALDITAVVTFFHLLRKLHKTVLEEIEKAVSNVITERLNEVENSEDY
jgi:hypothetical protein